jgi:uncharacterized membrane protein
MLGAAIALVNLFGAGLLAGEEFVIRYGVRAPLASMEAGPHILLRQSFIRRLRILVPTIFFVTLLSGIAAVWLGSSGPAFLLRCAGLAALLGFLAVTFGGTVPINQAVLTWNPSAPPDDWLTTIRHWERLDSARTWMALLAFACFAAPMALPLPVLR